MWKKKLTSFQRASMKNLEFHHLSVRDLEALRSPPCQRLIDPHHVNDLYDYQKEVHKKYGKYFFLPIAVAQLGKQRFVIDGQHRLACAARLRGDGAKVDLPAVFAEVETMAELEEKYEALNKNKPASSVSAPLYAWKKFVKPIEAHFREKYAPYIKVTKTPQSPNFNVDHLSDYLKTHQVGKKADYDAKTFICATERLNAYYIKTFSASVEPHFPSTVNVSKQIRKAFDKKIKNGKRTSPCLLGVYRRFEWVERVLYHLQTGTFFEDVDHFPLSRCGKNIDRQLRKQVWMQHSESECSAECSACGEAIDVFSFVCGHVVSRFSGGETVVSNLKPVCALCNRDMGAENLNEYSERLKKSISS